MTSLGDFIQTPFGTELFEFAVSLVVFIIALWILSNIFAFKKKNFKTAFLASLTITGIPFLINLIRVIPEVEPAYMTAIAIITRVLEIILLIVVIQVAYRPKWWKTIITSALAYIIKMMAMGFWILIVLFLLTDVMQDIAQERERYDNYDRISLEQAQQKIDFTILVPKYIPQNYKFDFVKIPKDISLIYTEISRNKIYGEAVGLTYDRYEDGERAGGLLIVAQRKSKPPFFPLYDTKVMIDGYESYYHEDAYDSRSLMWYSNKSDLLFWIHTGTHSDLNKEEIIKIAESME